MIGVDFEVTGQKQVLRVFNKVIDWSKVRVHNLTKEQADKGGYYMKSLMPRWKYGTGAMIQAVKVEDAGNKKGWGIVVRNPKTKDGRSRPYHIYYNRGSRGRYTGTVKSGEYHFFEKTYNYLGKTYPEKFEKELREILRS